MAAMVKPKGVKNSYIRLENQAAEVTPNTWGLQITKPLAVMKGNGELLEGTEVSTNQRVVLNLGMIENPKYQLLIKHNPLLAQYGQVQMDSMREPGEHGILLLYFKADRALDLGTLDWLVRLYLVD
jgi:hypothetical protein